MINEDVVRASLNALVAGFLPPRDATAEVTAPARPAAPVDPRVNPYLLDDPDDIDEHAATTPLPVDSVQNNAGPILLDDDAVGAAAPDSGTASVTDPAPSEASTSAPADTSSTPVASTVPEPVAEPVTEPTKKRSGFADRLAQKSTEGGGLRGPDAPPPPPRKSTPRPTYQTPLTEYSSEQPTPDTPPPADSVPTQGNRLLAGRKRRGKAVEFDASAFNPDAYLSSGGGMARPAAHEPEASTDSGQDAALENAAMVDDTFDPDTTDTADMGHASDTDAVRAMMRELAALRHTDD